MADGFDGVWAGLKEITAAIEKVSGQADTGARSIVARSAAVVEAAAKDNFQGSRKRVKGPRGGRAYDPPEHVGGDKPNIITGTLRRSIRTDPIVRHGLAEYGTIVAPRVIYARRVELGFDGSKGYPYFSPAVQETKAKLQTIAAEEWRKFLHP